MRVGQTTTIAPGITAVITAVDKVTGRAIVSIYKDDKLVIAVRSKATR